MNTPSDKDIERLATAVKPKLKTMARKHLLALEIAGLRNLGDLRPSVAARKLAGQLEAHREAAAKAKDRLEVVERIEGNPVPLSIDDRMRAREHARAAQKRQPILFKVSVELATWSHADPPGLFNFRRGARAMRDDYRSDLERWQREMYAVAKDALVSGGPHPTASSQTTAQIARVVDELTGDLRQDRKALRLFAALGIGVESGAAFDAAQAVKSAEEKLSVAEELGDLQTTVFSITHAQAAIEKVWRDAAASVSRDHGAVDWGLDNPGAFNKVIDRACKEGRFADIPAIDARSATRFHGGVGH